MLLHVHGIVRKDLGWMYLLMLCQLNGNEQQLVLSYFN